MTNLQRTKNDAITENRREMADAIMKDNRNRNDDLTQERRAKADRIMEENRFKNDEKTNSRRKLNDRNPWRTLAIFLLVLSALALGVYLIFK